MENERFYENVNWELTYARTSPIVSSVLNLLNMLTYSRVLLKTLSDQTIASSITKIGHMKIQIAYGLSTPNFPSFSLRRILTSEINKHPALLNSEPSFRVEASSSSSCVRRPKRVVMIQYRRYDLKFYCFIGRARALSNDEIAP